ncbi:MAG TPA: hypothetical protein PKZ69_08425 [Candidatus Cloacimonadota bacterium]|nr:hypothetical protein [Candidatus Cloacimonadota bacterium]
MDYCAAVKIDKEEQYQWLTSPIIDLGQSVPGGYTLKFNIAITNSYGELPSNIDKQDRFAVVLLVEQNDNWVPVQVLKEWTYNGKNDLLDISQDGIFIMIDLTGYSGRVKFGFYCESQEKVSNIGTYYIFIDDFMITYDATLPVELSAFNTAVLTNNTVSLSWTTQSENNLFGYHLHRGAEELLNSAERITNTLIAPTNTSNEANYSYVDTEVLPETMYYYWLQTVECNGTSQYFGPYSVTTNEENIVPELPVITAMQNVYPNPFTGNSQANFGVDVKEGETAQFAIYNIKGQVVKTYNEGVE